MKVSTVDDQYINRLVAEWDDVYKKGQLSLWILLALYDGRKYSQEMTQYMYTATNGTFNVKEQSLYRALRRFEAMKMVTVTKETSPNGGPPRKYFDLSDTGREVLAQFVAIHIEPLRKAPIAKLLESLRRETT